MLLTARVALPVRLTAPARVRLLPCAVLVMLAVALGRFTVFGSTTLMLLLRLPPAKVMAPPPKEPAFPTSRVPPARMVPPV